VLDRALGVAEQWETPKSRVGRDWAIVFAGRSGSHAGERSMGIRLSVW